MPKTKIYRLSPKTVERCKKEIAKRNPSLDNGDFVYAEDILIAMALGNGQFRYLGPLADRDNKSSESNLKTLLFHLGIIGSESASIDHLIVLDEKPSVAPSKTLPPPAEPIGISRIQKSSEGFCFLPDDARKIKDIIEATKGLSQRTLCKNAGPKGYVSNSLNKKPVLLFDFVKILNVLIDKEIVTLEKGTTIEGLLELPEVDENNPLELSKKDISFKGNRIFLSETARDKINGLLFKKNLDIESFFSKLEETSIKDVTLRSFLKGAGIHRNSFLKILNLLADQGVLKEPETSFKGLLVYDLVPDNFMITRPVNGENRILLKQDPANAIQARLVANGLTQKSIATKAGFGSVLMVNNLLHDQTINPENLKKILRVLLDHQIITLPEGSDVDGFVDLVCAQPASYLRTQAGRAASTTGNCMASNGGQSAEMAVLESRGGAIR